MASLWKRPDSKYWIACFTTRDGKQLKRSTRMTDRAKAQKLADTYEEEARAKRTATQARRVLASIYKQYGVEDVPTQTVSQVAESFLNGKKREVEGSTYSYYSGNLKRFRKWLGDRADRDIADITRKDVTDYRNFLTENRVGKTVNHTMQCVKALFRHAKEGNLIVDDPTEFLKAVRSRSVAVRRPFTLPEIQAVLNVANAEWRSMIRFGFYTGQRLSDIAALTWANIDLERGTVSLQTRKTGRNQILALHPALLQQIESLPAGDNPRQPLHPVAFGHLERTKKTARLSNQFAELLIDAGLRTAVKHDQEKGRSAKRAQHELSFHSLRHTTTSLLKDAGIPASVVQDFIGHDDEAMSAHYTHTGTEAIKRAADALPTL